ncbi:MAG: M1 family metallopeptidase, partial [Planctomycetota bacterium]
MPRATFAFLAVTLLVASDGRRARARADLPKESPRVVHYTIRAELLPEQRSVRARMDVVWRNATVAPVHHLYFHLYLNAFRDKESTFLRESGGEGRGERRWDEKFPGRIDVQSMKTADGQEVWKGAFEAPDDGNEDDATLARVALPSPVAPGETVALDVSFETVLPRLFRRSGFSGDPANPRDLFFMVAQWFPKVAALRQPPGGQPFWNRHQYHANTEFFADYGVYQVELTVPGTYVVGATGRRLNELDAGEGRVTYLHKAEDVHDFAWCAFPGFLEELYDWEFDRFCAEARPPAIGANLRALLARTAEHRGVPEEAVKPAGSVRIRFLYPNDHAHLRDRFKWSVGAALACYGIWYGPYPYDVLTVVDPPDGGRAAGGMEYPTLITAGTRYLAPAWRHEPESVTVHEFGHQYWYGLVASNEFEEAWLDEG